MVFLGDYRGYFSYNLCYCAHYHVKQTKRELETIDTASPRGLEGSSLMRREAAELSPAPSIKETAKTEAVILRN